MCADELTPPLGDFAQWLSSKRRIADDDQALGQSAMLGHGDYPRLLKAARSARDALPDAAPARFEVLQLLTASSGSDGPRPHEVTTTRGFRVTLAYDEGAATELPSICVLVTCPPDLIDVVAGQIVFLWTGAHRFELGHFDSEGKAIGTLPAGIDISPSDVALGRVTLEEPPAPTDR
jgi:hypothetical protein